MNKKFALSFSGGKDSIMSLYLMMKKGYTPEALLITVKEKEGCRYSDRGSRSAWETGKFWVIPLHRRCCSSSENSGRAVLAPWPPALLR